MRDREVVSSHILARHILVTGDIIFIPSVCASAGRQPTRGIGPTLRIGTSIEYCRSDSQADSEQGSQAMFRSGTAKLFEASLSMRALGSVGALSDVRIPCSEFGSEHI